MAFPAVVAATLIVILSPVFQRTIPRGSATAEKKVPATIALKVGAENYDFTGPALCQHMERGSIYNTPAERWSVMQDGSGNTLTMTLWRPAKGGENMLTLNILAGGKQHDVNTVTGGGATAGTGSATFAPAGSGGVFTINATAKTGAKIAGTIKCEAFTAPAAVAGD